MGKTLIIAEKPSIAKSIAEALEIKGRKDGYYESDNYYITYAYGHLYQLYDVSDYDPEKKSWKLEYYPFIPEEFKYKPIDNPGAKKQIKVIKELLKDSSLVINACDGDREGELLFSEIKHDLKIKQPIKRLWITSHTTKDVNRGLKELKPEMLNLESAGSCRQKIDWILGINTTTTFTLITDSNQPLKLGRVVLPTLKLVFDREKEIIGFKSKPIYSLKATFKDKCQYSGTFYKEGQNKFLEKDSLEKIAKEIQNKEAIISKKLSEKKKTMPPKLFSLIDLQGYITSHYKAFTADKVLKVTQELYEKKYVTYPRTASRVLDDSQVEDAKESYEAILDKLDLKIDKTGKFVFHTEKRLFDSSKVDSHPAIIPTYVVPDINSLSEDEKIVYMEIVKRFMAMFMEPMIHDTLEIVTRVDSYEFITRGKALIQEGWKELYSNLKDEESEDEEDKIEGNNLSEGDKSKVFNQDIKEGKTVPPKHYTEATLLSAMENCGKHVEDESEVLKGFTIGTPATSAETIKKLIECNYILKKGSNLLITELGVKIITMFPAKNLMRVDFTGQIEKTLKDIEKGNYNPDEFMAKMTNYIEKTINEMKGLKFDSLRTEKNDKNIIGKCPACKKNVIENQKAYSCEGTINKECNFTLWKDDKYLKSLGKKMTATIAKSLVKEQKALIKGIKSKKNEGYTYDAVIHLKQNKESGYWNYEMTFPQKKK